MELVNESPRVLGNRYEVGDLLGRGGMAEVHLGRDTRLGRTVAIKLLRIDLARDPTFQARFRREAQSAAGLNHPAIVAVYDTGEEQLVDGHGGIVALPYIVMEYVEGKTLRDFLVDGNPLDVGYALDVTAGVLSALEYSHRSGIVHRDIKPANVMIGPRGEVKVMDFGIARAMADASTTMTQTQAVIGTAQYLSPEQARGETVDARSDLYSAGCLLFELITGRPPFVADSAVAVAYQHVRENPNPPSTFNPMVPDSVDQVVMHSLAKDREHRYQSADEFRTDIEAARNGRRVSAYSPRSAGAAGAETEYLGAAAGPGTRAMAPVDAGRYGDSGPSVLPGGPDRNGDEYGYGGRRDGRDSQQRGPASGYAMLAVAVLVVFGLIAFGVWKLTGSGDAQLVTVRNVTGMEQAKATETLSGLGLQSTVTEEPSNTVPKGNVIRQDPAANTQVDKGSTVTLYVSSGSDSVAVPDLSGKSQDDARTALEEAGLKVGQVTTRDDPKVKADRVIETNPKSGQNVAKGSSVSLILSSGQVQVPDVTGMSYSEAKDLLDAKGLKIKPVYQVSDLDADTVISQDNKNASVAQGATVTVYVSKGPEVTTPPVTTPPTTTPPTTTPPTAPDPSFTAQ
jgi:eukaryotic-like serine/threonine-protein kinase